MWIVAESFVNVRLFQRPRDYPTTYLKEIHTPRLSCGSLNVVKFAVLFNVSGHFEV